ncbi:hypothetical protein ACFVW1_29195 [Streptomyces olivochromogenes]|uniref:hypothetical protein n=1 Tax=Streptomyces olivochromogenes TaxID=1963 RepID=UPI0036DA729A
MSRTAASHPLRSTDGISERLEELQLTLGQGPCVDAYLHGSAVLTPDLPTGELQHRWAVFADAAVEAGARASFVLPPQMGAISPGVLDLYSDVPTVLDTEEPADALAFADLATLLLLDAPIEETGAPIEETGAPIGGPLPDRCFEDLGADRAESEAATGILTANSVSVATRPSSGSAPTPVCRGAARRRGRRRGGPPAPLLPGRGTRTDRRGNLTHRCHPLNVLHFPPPPGGTSLNRGCLR